MIRGARAGLLAALALGATVAPAGAQQSGVRAGIDPGSWHSEGISLERASRTSARDSGRGGALDRAFPPTRSADSVRRARTTPWAVAASAAIPGAGQALLRQRRALVYVVVEALAWSQYTSNTRIARRTRDGYRDLASSVARAPFSDVRRTGDFDYYERMEYYVASGRFDLAGGGLPLRPEEDTGTFNGAMWLLARRTYWADVAQPPPRGSIEWTRAEAFYLQRAIRPEFRWSWEGAEREHAEFRRLIRESNDRYRSALSDLGLALGNHVLSAIDAAVSVRLQQRPTALGREYRVVFEIPTGRRRGP